MQRNATQCNAGVTRIHSLARTPLACFCLLAEVRLFAGKVVSPSTPRETRGLYWGYVVRAAESPAEVLSDGTWKVGVMKYKNKTTTTTTTMMMILRYLYRFP